MTIKLTEKQQIKLTNLQKERKLLEEKEALILEIILDLAGIKIPVKSIELKGDSIVVELPDEPGNEIPIS